MNIEKAYWSADDRKITLSVPVTKFNRKRRTVSGFATLDNVDEHGDIVTAEASREAFARFRGNIREQHSSLAVGKIVDLQERDYVADDGNVYKGMYVTAYISEGAEDTWKKVTEGILTGFSIGGALHKFENVNHNGTMVRKITKFSLHELSLVDNPANQLANVISFVKVNDGVVASGIAADVRSEHVFYCPEDRIVITETAETKDCEVCDTSMQKIGWFEYTDDESKKSAIKESVQKFLGGSEGGVQMSQKENETVEVEETVVASEVEEPKVDPVVEKEDEDAEVVETPAEVEEVDIQKMLAETRELAEKLTKTVEQLDGNHEEVSRTVKEVRDEVSTLTKSVEEKFSEFGTRFEALEAEGKEITEKVNGLTERQEALNKDVTSLQDASAIRKSSDLGGSDTVVRKSSGSLWDGKFFDVNRTAE